MSNIIAGHKGTPYFQLPDSFVRSGALRDLSGSAVKYYVFLCRQMNLTGQVELEFTNDEICNYAGIKDHSTAKKAREELQACGRIRLRKGPSGGFIHVMLDDSGNVFTPAKGRNPVRYHTRREKRLRKMIETVNTSPAGRPASPTAPAASPPARISKRCYVHRCETEHWERDGELICQKCHPNPEAQRAPQPLRPPTARDLGFA